MSPQVPTQVPRQGPDDDLLSALLADEVPGRHAQLRPARLRSTTQQRHEALRGFRLRNWVDRALQMLERGLVVAAVLAFGYWLVDGYGRDWLHQLGRAEAAQSAAPVATPTPPIGLPAASAPEAAARADTPPLPFTRPEGDLPLEPGAGPARDAFLAPQTVHTAPDIGDPRPRRLAMPSIGAGMQVYEIYVVEGEWQVAEYAAGFHHGTALPGMVGNSVISGHAGLRGAVFKDLYRLRPGDDLIVETDGWRYVYRVRSSLSVWPHQVEVMDQTPSPVLTLITCTNWDTQRLVVVADLVDARPL
ncbi:MAG TPA: sortase [Chloroflexaceae bacterium]|mgnify:CR=1 FL=1|nr:sortase [Chloroflexaceae bacterium]